MAGDHPPLLAPPPAFRAERYDLAQQGMWLSALTLGEALRLGEILAAIDPWVRYGTSAANLMGLFMPSADGGIRLAVRAANDQAPIGVMVIRHPWLTGPYMQFLALVPGAQGHGHGHALLQWFEDEARRGGARNIWICAAGFNDGALRLYTRVGFEQVTILDDLITAGVDEILMRKRLTGS